MWKESSESEPKGSRLLGQSTEMPWLLREMPVGFICFERAKPSRSSFGSPVVRGLLQVTLGAVSMTFDAD